MAKGNRSLCAALLLLICATLQVETRNTGRSLKSIPQRVYTDAKYKGDTVIVSYASPEEEAFRPVPVTKGKIFSWWQWIDAEQLIKYVVLEVAGAPVTASKFKDITNQHLHVGAPRGKNATNPLVLTANGKPEDDIRSKKSPSGWAIIAKGWIDNNVVKNHYAKGQPAGLKLDTAWSVWAQITAGNAYYNLHTVTFRDGEVRGQIDWPELSAFQNEAAAEIQTIKVPKKDTRYSDYVHTGARHSDRSHSKDARIQTYMMGDKTEEEEPVCYVATYGEFGSTCEAPESTEDCFTRDDIEAFDDESLCCRANFGAEPGQDVLCDPSYPPEECFKIDFAAGECVDGYGDECYQLFAYMNLDNCETVLKAKTAGGGTYRRDTHYRRDRSSLGGSRRDTYYRRDRSSMGASRRDTHERKFIGQKRRDAKHQPWQG